MINWVECSPDTPSKIKTENVLLIFNTAAIIINPTKRSLELEYIQERMGGEEVDATNINNSFKNQKVETQGPHSLFEV